MLKSIDEQCAHNVRIGLAPSKLEWPPGSAMSHTSSPLAKSSTLTFIGGDGARNDDYDRKALLASRLTRVWQFSSWTRSTTTASSSTRCRARRHAALRVEVYVGSMSMTFSRRARRLWRRRIFPKQDRHVLLQHQHITTKLQCHLNCLGT